VGCSSHALIERQHNLLRSSGLVHLHTFLNIAASQRLACAPALPRPALQTSGEGMEASAVRYSVWDATATQGQYASTFRVMQADFGSGVAALTAGGVEYPLAVATPLDGCNPLQNEAGSVKGTVVLIQRGEPASQGAGGRARGLGVLPGRCWGGCCVAPLRTVAAHSQCMLPTAPDPPTDSDTRPLFAFCLFISATHSTRCLSSSPHPSLQAPATSARRRCTPRTPAQLQCSSTTTSWGPTSHSGQTSPWVGARGWQHWVACASAGVPGWGGGPLLQKCQKAQHMGSAPLNV
jgi:hypothetical protein